MSSGFVNGDIVHITASKDVGFFGIGSGAKKHRILLGGKDDKTNRLAIACFENNEYPNGEGTKWVNLHVSSDVIVKVEISSLAERLKILPEKIVDLAKNDYKNGTNTLEKLINEKVNAYKADLQNVKFLYQLVSNFLVSPEVNKQKLEEVIRDVENFPFSNINNNEIREACFKCVDQLSIILRNLNLETFGRNVFHKGAVAIVPLPSPDVIKENITKAKSKIHNHLGKFEFELRSIDRNLSIEIAGPIVTRTLWGDTNLVLSTARPVKNSESSGKLAARLQLIPDQDRYSVLVYDNTVYHTRPKANADYVPFSKDGKTWVLLSVKSLSSRIGLKPEYIRNAAENWNDLHKVIEEFITARNGIEGLINNFKQGDLQTNWNDYQNIFIRYIDEYIEKLDKEGAYYIDCVTEAVKLKTVIINSDTKARAIAQIEYHGWDPQKDRTKIKITDDNKADFSNSFFTPSLIILRGDHNAIHVETDGFVYTQKPKSTEEYLPYKFKKGYWILLNANSLAKRIRKDINEIKPLLDDSVEFNKIIDAQKERRPRKKNL